MEQTTACPTWCEWQHNQNHIEGDVLADGTGEMRSHVRTVAEARIAGHLVGVDLVQEEVTRAGVVEMAPVLVSLSEVEMMTAAECRTLAGMLSRAAAELEAVAR